MEVRGKEAQKLLNRLKKINKTFKIRGFECMCFTYLIKKHL